MSKEDSKLDKCTNSSCPIRKDCKRYKLAGKGGKHIHFHFKTYSSDGVHIVVDCEQHIRA
jgi:hypothetical protein